MHARPCRAHAYFHARLDGAGAVIMRQTQTPRCQHSSAPADDRKHVLMQGKRRPLLLVMALCGFLRKFR